MALTPQQIQQMNQVTGLNKPATPAVASGQSRAQQILALGKSAQPPTPNVVEETGSNYFGDSGVGGAVKDLMGGGNIGSGSAKLQKGDILGGVEDLTLGTASDAVKAIFAPISAPLQTLLSHVAAANAANPNKIKGATIEDTPQAKAARQQLSDWAQANPQLAKTLGDAFTVGTGALGSGALDATVGDTVNSITETVTGAVSKTKDVLSKAKEAMTPASIPEDTTEGIVRESGQLAPEAARAAAWKDLQPKSNDQNVTAYRAQGATNPKTITGKVTLNPTGADNRVLDVVTPLYEDGTLTGSMPTETKISAIEGKSKELTQQTDNFVADNNKVIDLTSRHPEVKSLDKALNSAKSANQIIFGGDTSVEGAYDAVTNEFLSGLEKGSETTADLVSLRNRLKAFDGEMQGKFPNVYKNARTGELNPTDNARANAIRDVHETVRDFIADNLPPNNPYKSLLQQNSSLIRAAEMVNEGASNASKIDSWLDLLGKHPYIKLVGAWEGLKHTVAPGLPGL